MAIIGVQKLKYDGNIAFTHIAIDIDESGEYKVWWNNNVRVAVLKVKDFDIEPIKVWVNKNE